MSLSALHAKEKKHVRQLPNRAFTCTPALHPISIHASNYSCFSPQPWKMVRRNILCIDVLIAGKDFYWCCLFNTLNTCIAGKKSVLRCFFFLYINEFFMIFLYSLALIKGYLRKWENKKFQEAPAANLWIYKMNKKWP